MNEDLMIILASVLGIMLFPFILMLGAILLGISTYIIRFIIIEGVLNGAFKQDVYLEPMLEAKEMEHIKSLILILKR